MKGYTHNDNHGQEKKNSYQNNQEDVRINLLLCQQFSMAENKKKSCTKPVKS